MAIHSDKVDELKSLRIERDTTPEPPLWARRWIVTGIAVVVLLGLVTLAYRLLSPALPEVQVARAVAQTADTPGVVLSAS